MTRTRNKTVGLAVAMIFFFIATVVLAATGAWFTDKSEHTTDDVEFGAINIAIENGTVTAKNTFADLTGPVMPGSDVEASFTVSTIDNEAWIRYKMVVVEDSTGLNDASEYVTIDLTTIQGYDSDGWVYVASSCTNEEPLSIEFTTKISNTVKNVAQKKAFRVKLVVEALQKSNTAETNTSSIWEGVEIEQVADVA